MAEEVTTQETHAPVLSANQIAEWGNDTRIIEPGSVTEDGQKLGGEEAPKEEEPKTETEPQVELPLDEPEEPVTVPDPGEYTPKDYSFEVTTYDEEGNKPRTVKVSSVEQWDQILDGEPNFGSATALMKAQRLATRMENNLERDQQTYQEKKEAYDQATEAQSAKTEATNTMVAEINYLVEKGDLPKVAPQYLQADWSDPEVAKQAGVKEQLAVLNYMRRENATRLKAGLKPMTSVLDAFNSYQLDQAKKGQAETRTRQAQTRKEVGAKVAGSTPNPVTVAPKGIAVGRGGSLRDLGNSGW